MAKRGSALGRGMDALLPDGMSNILSSQVLGKPGAAPAAASEEETGQDRVLEIALEKIIPSDSQPRRQFHSESVQELAESIKTHGVLQPILIMQDEKQAGKYRIIAGERRYRACMHLKRSSIPCLMQQVTDVQRFEMALVENIQRESLSPIDEALAYEHLLRITQQSQQELANSLGKSRSSIANSIRLLRLPEELRLALQDGQISAGHARALLVFKDEAEQMACYQRIIAEALSVREVEALSQGLEVRVEAAASSSEPELSRVPELEEILEDREVPPPVAASSQHWQKAAPEPIEDRVNDLDHTEDKVIQPVSELKNCLEELRDEPAKASTWPFRSREYSAGDLEEALKVVLGHDIRLSRSAGANSEMGELRIQFDLGALEELLGILSQGEDLAQYLPLRGEEQEETAAPIEPYSQSNSIVFSQRGD